MKHHGTLSPRLSALIVFKSLSRLRIGIFFWLMTLISYANARTCIVTEIHWHIWITETELIQGVTQYSYCLDSGGSSTNEGGGGGSTGGGTGETTTEEGTPPCVHENANAVIDDPRLMIGFETSFPYGEDATREGGFHHGVDFIVPTGTPIVSPVDGFVGDFYQDIETDHNIETIGNPYQQGNRLQILVAGSYTPPPKNGASEVIPNTIHSLNFEHLDHGFLNRAGLTYGASVRKGVTIIGYTDNTGRIKSMPPHLHVGAKETNADGKVVEIDPGQLMDCGK